MERLICVLVGYVFGLIQTGYLYGKKNGVDLRKKGSGNAGTTNALRTMDGKPEELRCWETVLNVLRQ